MATDPWAGWAGAIIGGAAGAIIGACVAVFVLWRTLKDQRSSTERLTADLRASDRENAALNEVTRLVQSLTGMVSIGAAAGRQGPDVQAMAFEAMAGTSSAARIAVLLAPRGDDFTTLLSEAVELFRVRASDFTPFGTRRKQSAEDMAARAGGIIGPLTDWFHPGKERGEALERLRGATERRSDGATAVMMLQGDGVV